MRVRVTLLKEVTHTTSACTGGDTSLVARVVVGCAVKQAANDCTIALAIVRRASVLLIYAIKTVADLCDGRLLC